VNGNTTRVKRRDARRRHNSEAFVCAFAQAAQEGCLSRSRLAGKKNVTARAVYERRSRFHHIGCTHRRFHGAKKGTTIQHAQE